MRLRLREARPVRAVDVRHLHAQTHVGWYEMLLVKVVQELGARQGASIPVVPSAVVTRLEREPKPKLCREGVFPDCAMQRRALHQLGLRVHTQMFALFIRVDEHTLPEELTVVSAQRRNAAHGLASAGPLRHA